ncbi:hypothetical protein [Streptomyces fulvoviolaceus]|uniref:hypothetical protein n=1 Tax=Streptomyces fulvoviolaceus TaxID=285535 RepID=UPI0004CB9D61|nr:hypothetical protein [Streptomyces fulvoviolaceus]MCT9076606.1 hypothetical protein [Streptomyces fulvoviolaceus]
MRPLVSRGLLLPPLLCAALVLVPAGTAAAAVDAGQRAQDHSVAQLAAWPGSDADALVEHLGVPDSAEHSGDVLAPLLDAVTAIAEHAGGHLDAAEAAGYARSVETANATVQEQLRTMGGTATDSTQRSVAPAADPVSDLLATVQSAVDGLLGALTSLDLSSVLGTVTGLLSTVVGAVTGLLGGGLPSLPAAQVPAT